MFTLDTARQLVDDAPAATGAAVCTAEPIEVTRWRRLRRDRAYVRVHGAHVGYRDLATGEICAFDTDDVELIARVTSDLQRRVDASTR